jgi:hypothetical protein
MITSTCARAGDSGAHAQRLTATANKVAPMKRIPESSRHPNPFLHTSPCGILPEPVLNRRYGNRRYRITEGAEEIQMRKVAGFLFGYMRPGREKMRPLQ